jgi:hypothetical protein
MNRMKMQAPENRRVPPSLVPFGEGRGRADEPGRIPGGRLALVFVRGLRYDHSSAACADACGSCVMPVNGGAVHVREVSEACVPERLAPPGDVGRGAVQDEIAGRQRAGCRSQPPSALLRSAIPARNQ